MNEKFTISARQLYGSMGYKSDNFYNWWLAKADKLSLVPGEDYAPTDNDWFVNLAAAEKLIRASRWGKRPLAVDLLRSLRTGDALIVMSPPDAAGKYHLPPVKESIGVTVGNMNGVQRGTFILPNAPAEASPTAHWSGASDLYDPAKVGEIERDSVTNRRRYQLHRTPGTNNQESPWFRNEDELESWLMAKGACKDERWNLEVTLSSTASLIFIKRTNAGGKRVYQYIDGPLDKTSGWLDQGAHLGEWLKGIGARFVEPEPQLPAVAEPTAAEIVVAAPEPHDPYALGFQIVQTDSEHEDVLYTEWGPEALDLEVVPPDCPNPLFPVNARALHSYMQIGIYFSKWIKGRIVECEFVENEDFLVFDKFIKNPQSERPPLEYWLTSDAAQRLAADVRSERGKQVIKFLDERLKRLESLKKVGQPASPQLGASRLNQAASAWLDGMQTLPPPAGVVTPAAEVVVDADTGELIPREIDGFVIHQRAKDGYVNATAMCKAADKRMQHYLDNQQTKDYLVALESEAGIPASLLVETNRSGPYADRGTWVHPRIVVDLARWCSPVFAVKVDEWVRDWLTTGKTPATPALDISDPHSMMVWLNQASSIALQKTAENQKLNVALTMTQYNLGVTTRELDKSKEDLHLKEEQREAAITEKQEEERKAAAIARAVSLEAESKIWSGWAKEVEAITGVGPRIATKILQAYGILCRHKVEGCSNTDEPAISSWYKNNEWFCYKLQPAVGKTITEDKLDEEGNVTIGPDGKPVQIVVEVLDQDGNQTSVHSRTVKITPKGCPLVMNILTTCNETLLSRLINLVKVKELKILSGRYTFAEKHNFAHKLFPKSSDTVHKMIRFVEPKDSVSGLWEVWAFLGSKGTCKVHGQGSTLEQAYMQLASNMKGLLPAYDCI